MNALQISCSVRKTCMNTLTSYLYRPAFAKFCMLWSSFFFFLTSYFSCSGKHDFCLTFSSYSLHGWVITFWWPLRLKLQLLLVFSLWKLIFILAVKYLAHIQWSQLAPLNSLGLELWPLQHFNSYINQCLIRLSDHWKDLKNERS